MDALPDRSQVEALHLRLREQLTALRPLVVADVMRVFLEVSSLASEQGLWSLEFAFDEDDGRVARIEARFWNARVAEPDGELRGYAARLVLPRLILVGAPVDHSRAAERVWAMESGYGGLVARFVRALTDLGAYRGIEPVELVSAEAELI
jgi:hypothetical protein